MKGVTRTSDNERIDRLGLAVLKKWPTLRTDRDDKRARMTFCGRGALVAKRAIGALGRRNPGRMSSSMPMSQNSILVGKCYRTPEDEMSQVTAVEQDEVIFTSVSSTHGAGLISKAIDKRLSLARFAEEAESEVLDKP
jgi:hypothetical protein